MWKSSIPIAIALILNTLILLMDKNNKFVYGFRTMLEETKCMYDIKKAKTYQICLYSISFVLLLSLGFLGYYNLNVNKIIDEDIYTFILIGFYILLIILANGKLIQKISKIKKI